MQTRTYAQKFITEYSSWTRNGDKLHREYIFNDFLQAFDFMSKVAPIAESSNHHPEWFNVYSKVIVDLTTHEANGITELDFKLAKTMEEIANNIK